MAEDNPGAEVVEEEVPQEKSLIELVTELVDMVNRFIREQAHDTLQKAIVLPLQKLGLNLAFTIVAAMLTAVALVFVAVGSFLLLANAIGYPWAYLLIAFVYLAGAAVLVWLRVRTVQ